MICLYTRDVSPGVYVDATSFISLHTLNYVVGCSPGSRYEKVVALPQGDQINDWSSINCVSNGWLSDGFFLYVL
jgi:hypothetical protein